MKKYLLTFDTLEEALNGFCGKFKSCDDCPLKNAIHKSCHYYCKTHPEELAALIGAEVIEVEDKPKLTEQELAICRAVGAKWVSREKHSKPYVQDFVSLWETAPSRSAVSANEREVSAYFSGRIVASVSSALFPSLKPGDCICVEEVKND